VLGSAAGGGLPQWNCGCANCRAARRGDGRVRPRREASAAVSADGVRWLLLNASPDVRTQLARCAALHPRGVRDTPIAAIALSSAELDHTLGLLALREGEPLLVLATDRVRRAFTTDNALYRVLERRPGQTRWRRLVPGAPVAVADGGLAVDAVPAGGKPPAYAHGAPEQHEPARARRFAGARGGRGGRVGGRGGRDGDRRMSAAFVERLRREGSRRYHDRHPFHVRMHAGRLSPDALRTWVRNRYYYQTRIPVKDALILAKSDDPAFRRTWLRRIVEQDGRAAGEGGLALWLRLAAAVGCDPAAVARCDDVLPGVRRACDRYPALVRDWSLVEAVASSLTECFAPELMARRIAAWERHYPWVDPAGLAYFRARVAAGRRDAGEALAFVVAHATTPEVQDRCVAALVAKTAILWELLDALDAAAPEPFERAS